MKILMVACSRSGYDLMKTIESRYCHAFPHTEMTVRVKCSAMERAWGCAGVVEENVCAGGIEKEDILNGVIEEKDVRRVGKFSEILKNEQLGDQSISEYVAEQFSKVDAMVFIGAAGIAVRCIAPCLVHKSVDPAVVVVDETGKFCISLLSGHFGGANDLAEKIAGLIGGIPVVTTATDREQKFSVDVFAKRNNLVLEDWEGAKGISAAVLEGKKIGLVSRVPIEGVIPKELEFVDTERGKAPYEWGILISGQKEDPPFSKTLQLVPKSVVAGIGCRKGVSKDHIEEAVADCLKRYNILPWALKTVASIDLKKDERGILDFCACHGLPFITFSADELRQIQGDFSGSEFVKEVTGVDNVCERSALFWGGKLLCPKQVYGKVTVALAVQKECVRF